ncbi:MAG: hypothetical protein EP332_09695 [Bacteroidetes bacterium]|nr:MAG: hypothetical protein EP332_09695 [Bacteroidota bacterium]
MNKSLSSKFRYGILINLTYGLTLFLGFWLWELHAGADRVGDAWFHSLLFLFTCLLIFFFTAFVHRYVGIVLGLLSLVFSFVLNHQTHSKTSIFNEFAGIDGAAYRVNVIHAKYQGGIDYAAFMVFEYQKEACAEIAKQNKLIQSAEKLDLGAGLYTTEWWQPNSLRAPVQYYSNTEIGIDVRMMHDDSLAYLYVFKY